MGWDLGSACGIAVELLTAHTEMLGARRWDLGEQVLEALLSWLDVGHEEKGGVRGDLEVRGQLGGPDPRHAGALGKRTRYGGAVQEAAERGAWGVWAGSPSGWLWTWLLRLCVGSRPVRFPSLWQGSCLCRLSASLNKFMLLVLLNPTFFSLVTVLLQS